MPVIAPMVIGVAMASGAEVMLRPVADGTIVDGGVFGVFDGVPDAADWSFNESSYEGAITLVRSTDTSVEVRVVFEFNLSAVSLTPPVGAELKFTLRGAPRFPASPVRVLVYAYDADLRESLTDFDISATDLASVHEIAPYQSATTFRVDVGLLVTDAMKRGVSGIGFRFQVDPESQDTSNQAFMDILDSDLATKPTLTVTDKLPGDIDGDRDIDANDYTLFPFCMDGADTPVSVQCQIFDLDNDLDVDLTDFGILSRLQALYAGR